MLKLIRRALDAHAERRAEQWRREKALTALAAAAATRRELRRMNGTGQLTAKQREWLDGWEQAWWAVMRGETTVLPKVEITEMEQGR